MFMAVVLSFTVLPTMNIHAQTNDQPTVVSSMIYAAASTKGEKDSNADGVSDNGFKYIYDSVTNEATITGYSGTATNLTVPLSIEISAGTSGGTATTVNVVGIGAGAFEGNAGLVTVVMQGGTSSTGSGSNSSTATPVPGLKTIGDRAFYSCPSLTTITVPATVASIGQYAFSDCPALTAINVTAGNQRYISADGVLYGYDISSTVGGSATAVNGYYTLIQYPSGKTESTYNVPANIVNRLNKIGEGAFSGSLSLENVPLPETVTTIAPAAFQNCSALKTVAIPAKITTIPDRCFDGCSSLNSVSMPATVKTIGQYAFRNCTALTGMELPEDLTMISAGTFYGCTALSEMTIPSKVTTIDTQAFAYCTSLVKLVVPVSVTNTIGTGAFTGDTNLTIYCHEGSRAASYANTNKIGVVLTYTVKFFSETGALLSQQEVVYGSAAEAPTIGSRPGYKLTWSSDFSQINSDLNITASWTRVYNVTFIDKYKNRTKTVEVAYGSKATAPSWTLTGYKLGWDKTFANVTKDLTVYATWTDPTTGFVITKDTVKPASAGKTLTKGTVTYQVVSAKVQNPTVMYVSNSNTTLTHITIPTTVTISNVTYKVVSVAEKAFYGNQNLTTLTIGANVTTIEQYAFAKCPKLKKITIKSKKLSVMEKRAFYKIKSTAYMYAYKSKLTTYQNLLKKSGVSTKVVLRAI